MLELTTREKQVAELLKLGMRNHEIATRLDISQRTVEVHRANLMRKLGIPTLVRDMLKTALEKI